MPRRRSQQIRRTSDFFTGGLPRIFAHRGLALDAPENTLLAFRNGLDAGATHLETDVRASADGEPVLSHDPDLRRIAGRPSRIGQLSMAELRVIDLGHGQGFVSLADALEEFPDARFNIDLKSPAAIEPVVTAVTDAGATSRVLIASFSEVCRSRTVAALPGVATSASRPQLLRAVIAVKSGLIRAARRTLAGVNAVQMPERYRNIPIATPRVIAGMRRAEVEVHIWTVNDPADMARLLDAGVDGVITDRADLARALVDSRA